MSKTVASRLFAEKFKAERKAAGLTQKQLAEKAGLVTSVISRYETGNATPRQKTIDKLSKAVGKNLTPSRFMYTARLIVSISVLLNSLDESILKIMEIKKAIKGLDDVIVDMSTVEIRETEIREEELE